jgi:hypothetical protein
MMIYERVKLALTQAFDRQREAVAQWHQTEPGDFPGPCPEPSPDPDQGLAALAETMIRQHLANFRLWHVEDRARLKESGAEAVAQCKYDIDRLNQRRNDLIEGMDRCLVALLAQALPALSVGGGVERHNTETIGSAVDRMSIFSLKIFHMEEQTRREDVGPEHREACGRKLALLTEQREDLGRAVLELVDEYSAGTKRPKVFFQFKMYNDPSLNPALYGRKG